MTEGKRNIIHQLLEEYDIQTAEDIQDALKDLLGRTIKEMMEAEMDDHLGYEKSEHSDNDDYRNGYKRNIDQKIISMCTNISKFNQHSQNRYHLTFINTLIISTDLTLYILWKQHVHF